MKSKSDENGYYAEAYKKGNQVVIVTRGTEPKSLKDWGNDYDMFAGILPAQLKTAREF